MGKCIHCGKSFPDTNRIKRYCSKECYRAHRSERNRKAREERERLIEEEKKKVVAPISENGEPMHKTAGKYCETCKYYCPAVRCCDYYIETGFRRGCPVGWCDKYDEEKTRRESRTLRRRARKKMDNAKKMYDEYRRKFANAQGITDEEATKYQAVRLYKHWLQEKYKVEIDEGCQS